MSPWAANFAILLDYRSTLEPDAKAKMKADLSLAELLALVEIVDEHVDRNFPGIDPPRVLREIQQKLDTVISHHRQEIYREKNREKKTRVNKRLWPAPGGALESLHCFSAPVEPFNAIWNSR